MRRFGFMSTARASRDSLTRVYVEFVRAVD
jgi:hypothetical protein